MKSLIFVILSVILMSSIEAPEAKNPTLQQQFDTELDFTKFVKIYSYDGDLLRELAVEDVSEGTISVIDFLILDSSDYAFHMHGDYYYFTDKDMIGDLIN